MSYPPPPGLRTSQPSSKSSTPQSHPSLPARPPPPAAPLSSFKPAFPASSPHSVGAPGTRGGYGNSDGRSHGTVGYGGFTAFKPRSVASGNQAWSMQSPTVSAAPAPPAGFAAPQVNFVGAGYQASAYQQQQYPHYPAQVVPEPYAEPTPPQIRNPFPLPGQEPNAGRGGVKINSGFDPELEAQIAQWQSAYVSKDEVAPGKGGLGRSGRGEGAASAGGANAIPLGGSRPAVAPISNSEVNSNVSGDTGVAAVVTGTDGKQKTVVRSGGGKQWQDASLLEWDPAHFRIFVGNLAGEVTDESLLKAFSRYPSVQKARVVRDKRTTKSKGYGFVSFSDGDEYFRAAKEMQGKYIGSHPVLIKRSTTEIKAVTPANKKKMAKNGKGGGDVGGGANTGAGVHKKQAKTKGGLKILG